MIKQVDLGFGTILIDKSCTSEDLRRISESDDSNEYIFGLWMARDNKIYIARDSTPEMQWQTLIHELAEATMDYMEMPHTHDKILILETILGRLLRNKKLLSSLWRAQETK